MRSRCAGRLGPRLADRHRLGQSTVEYMLVISVIAIAAYAAAQYFVPGYAAGFKVMQQKTAQMTSDGVVGGR